LIYYANTETLINQKIKRARTQAFILVHSSSRVRSNFPCQLAKNSTKSSQIYTHYIQEPILHPARSNTTCVIPYYTSTDVNPIQM